MGRALLREDVTYRGRHGLSLRIDPSDMFQRAMLLDFFDPVLPAIIDKHVRLGGQVLDCGSFIGYIALRFAQAVGPDGGVHCFEPDPRVAARLREHVDANAMHHVSVTQAAVSDSSGAELELALTDQLGWASVGLDLWEAPETTTVTTVAIDDYVRERNIEPAFIKLDVEGAEGAALRGMTDTLTAVDAPLLIEWIPWRMEANGDDPEAVLATLTDCGYRPHAPVLRGGVLELCPGTHLVEGEDLLFLKG